MYKIQSFKLSIIEKSKKTIMKIWLKISIPVLMSLLSIFNKNFYYNRYENHKIVSIEA